MNRYLSYTFLVLSICTFAENIYSASLFVSTYYLIPFGVNGCPDHRGCFVRNRPSPNAYNPNFDYVQWDTAQIQANPNRWIPSKEYINMITDQKYHRGSWSIQIYTNNRPDIAQSYFGPAPAFYTPVRSTGQDDPSITTTLSPLYKAPYSIGTQSISVIDSPTVTHQRLVRAGLVSADGSELIPLLWRAGLPIVNAGQPYQDCQGYTITQNPPDAVCRFKDCGWFYFRDKSEEKLGADASACNPTTPNGCLSSDFPTLSSPDFWYTVPLDNNGAQYSEHTQFNPGTAPDGTTTVPICLASNFSNPTRQIASTTVFIELILH